MTCKEFFAIAAVAYFFLIMSLIAQSLIVVHVIVTVSGMVAVSLSDFNSMGRRESRNRLTCFLIFLSAFLLGPVAVILP